MSHSPHRDEEHPGSQAPNLQVVPSAAAPGKVRNIVLGIAAFVTERLTGVLDVPPDGSALVYLLLPLYMAAVPWDVLHAVAR